MSERKTRMQRLADQEGIEDSQIPQPPLRWMFVPVTYRASSERRKRTAPTGSFRSPTYPAGIFFTMPASSASGALPELMKPGEIALTGILSSASALASVVLLI